MREFMSHVLYYEEPGNQNGINSPKTQKMEYFRDRFIDCMKLEALYVEKEVIGKHRFVVVSCPKERLYQEAEAIRIELPLYGLIGMDSHEKKIDTMDKKKMKKLRNMTTRGTQVSAPFIEDSIDLFRNNDNPVLWSSLRCYLVHNILININVAGNEAGGVSKNIGLSYLLMIGAFKDSFALHDPSSIEPMSIAVMKKYLRDDVPYADLRCNLDRQWGRINSQQPIQDIRDYFGEKIAFYFDWVSTLMASLWIPAFLGFFVFLYGLINRFDDRKDAGVIQALLSSSDNTLTPVFAAIMGLWGTIFTEVWKRRQISMARKWNVDNFDNVEPDRPQFDSEKEDTNFLTNRLLRYHSSLKRMFKYACSFTVLIMMVAIVFISVYGVLVYRWYMATNYCETYNCNILHGTVITTLMNAISIIILGKIYEFIAFKMTEWENHQTLSEHNDALHIKLFAFQFVNNYTSLILTALFGTKLQNGVMIPSLPSEYSNTCESSSDVNCMLRLSFQLLVLMIVIPLPKFIKDVVFSFIKRIIHRYPFKESVNITSDDDITKQNYLLGEYRKPSADDFGLSEFLEKIIQYGHLLMFAASFPLAPALVLAFNLVDFKIDSKRLLRWNRRPIPFRDNDIGIWFGIINFIDICGVICNGFLIAFSSKFGRKLPLDEKFKIVIIYTHFIFFTKLALSIIIPDVPTWVKNSQKKEGSVLTYFMKKYKATGCDASKVIASNGDELRNPDEPKLPKSR